MEDPFDNPSFITESGTKVVVAASPNGLAVRVRTALGAESATAIPADVALELLANAAQLEAALKGE